jgi:hypothetical protein
MAKYEGLRPNATIGMAAQRYFLRLLRLIGIDLTKKLPNCDIGGLDLSLRTYSIRVIRMGFRVAWWVVSCADTNRDWAVATRYAADDR